MSLMSPPPPPPTTNIYDPRGGGEAGDVLRGGAGCRRYRGQQDVTRREDC